jgi:hypothetical protein
MTLDIISPGNYTPPAVDTSNQKNVVIAVNGSIRILPSQGRTIYTILRSYSEISIEVFRDDYDELDLNAFPEYRGLGDLPHESPPLRLLLSSRQSVVLENHRSFDLTAKSVIFSNQKDDTSPSEDTASRIPVNGAIIFVISISVIIALVVVNFVYIRYHENRSRSKKKEKKEIGDGFPNDINSPSIHSLEDGMVSNNHSPQLLPGQCEIHVISGNLGEDNKHDEEEEEDSADVDALWSDSDDEDDEISSEDDDTEDSICESSEDSSLHLPLPSRYLQDSIH